MQEIDPGIVGFEFPTLDFIICLHCAVQTFPQALREAVADATGTDDSEMFLQVAIEQFAVRDSDPVVHLLNCDLIECQKPLLIPKAAMEMEGDRGTTQTHDE